MEVCRITIPVDPNYTSPNRSGGRHWSTQGKRKEIAYNAAFSCWHNAGRPKATGPVRYHLIVRRGRVMDEDNIHSGLKACRDALFNHAITPSDSAKWVTIGSITQETGKQYGKRPEVVFIVETIE